MTARKTAFEEAVAKEFLRQLPGRAKAMAQMLGPAPGAREFRGREEVDLWMDRDESVDVQMEAITLMQQGLPADKAKAIASMKAFPNRAEMMEAAAPGDPEGQARYAHRMRMKSQNPAPPAEGTSDVYRSDA